MATLWRGPGLRPLRGGIGYSSYPGRSSADGATPAGQKRKSPRRVKRAPVPSLENEEPWDSGDLRGLAWAPAPEEDLVDDQGMEIGHLVNVTCEAASFRPSATLTTQIHKFGKGFL